MSAAICGFLTGELHKPTLHCRMTPDEIRESRRLYCEILIEGNLRVSETRKNSDANVLKY